MGQVTIKIIEDCYEQLEALVKEVAENKKKAGIPGKTTISEVISLLIRERKGAST